MYNTSIVVPIEKRRPNKVDLLQIEISSLQGVCDHLFVPFEPVILQESLVPEIFLANDKHGYTNPPCIKTQCTRCSFRKEFSVTDICPKCMHEMIKGELDRPREKYHGEQNGYNSSRIYTCNKCGFTLVADEWDQ